MEILRANGGSERPCGPLPVFRVGVDQAGPLAQPPENPLIRELIYNSLKRLRAFRTAPSRRVAAAPTKNIENNPMQSSRRPPQPTVWTENLTRRANQRHNFIIPEFAKRRRAQY